MPPPSAPPMTAAGQQQVFLARQAGENAAFFGAIAHAQVRDAEGGQPDGFGTVDADRAAAAARQAQDGPQRSGAARAVASQQRYYLALGDLHVDPMQDVRFAVPGVQVGDFQVLALSCVRSLQFTRGGPHISLHDVGIA